MPEEYEGMDEMDGAGVDTAVAEPVAEVSPVETPEVTEETPAEVVEETPEQVEEKKRLTGSARAKAKAERLEAKNLELQDRIARLEARAVDPVNHLRPKEQQIPAKPAPLDSPKLEDYGTFAEYNEAAIDYRVQKALQEKDAKESQSKILQSWEQKKAEARKDIPDFDEVLADMDPPAPVVLAVMNASPHTARIAHYLGNHPDEAKEINSMRPEAAALAIGEIAASFKVAKPTEKKESKAPPPLVPVKAAATVVKADRHSGLEEF